MTRTAIIRNISKETCERYLPFNYRVVNMTGPDVLIQGEDNAGWTLDGYVLPRLASGLHFGEEIIS